MLMLTKLAYWTHIVKTHDDSKRPHELEPLAVSVGAAAQMLSLSRQGTYNAIRTGEIPAVRLGGRVLVPLAALRRLLHGAAARD
jgi:excisionase family DNA binding protein